jgi:hypothetical protein
MYASPLSLLRLPPPRRRVNRGKFAPAERGRPPELLLRIVDARRLQFGGFWALRKRGWSIEDCACGHLMPYPRFTLLLGGGIRTSQNYSHEDDIKIKNEHVAGISRTYYLPIQTINRPPQSRETIPLNRLAVHSEDILEILWKLCQRFMVERHAPKCPKCLCDKLFSCQGPSENVVNLFCCKGFLLALPNNL